MATRKPAAGASSPGAAGGAGGASTRLAQDPDSGTRALLGGVLQRMGEVLGPGAIYSLVHYVAVEEGRVLAAGGDVGAADALARRVGDLLGLEVRIEAKPASVHVRVKPGPRFSLDSRATTALVVGLLEGALTATHRRKMQLKGEPDARRDGTLELDFTG